MDRDNMKRFLAEGVVTVVFFVVAVRLFRDIMGADNMKFLFTSKKAITQEKKKFNLQEHWAGRLPEQAQEILDIFHFPDIYERYQTPVPKGILLHGPPGTGKTKFARLISEVTGTLFFYASASQFDEVYVGKGSQRIRNLFEEAQKSTEMTFMENINSSWFGKEPVKKRAIIFIDELDAIGTRNQSVGQNATHATVSQLLTCMDGLTSSENIFVIAATNNLSQIDPALRRSGRFDRVITMSLPDQNDRFELLKFYLSSYQGATEMVKDGTLEQYAKRTEGWAPADIENMAKEARMAAIKRSILERKQQENPNISEKEDYTILNENIEKAYQDVNRKVLLSRSNTQSTWPKGL